MTQLQEAIKLLKRWDNLMQKVSDIKEDTENFLEAYRVSLDG